MTQLAQVRFLLLGLLLPGVAAAQTRCHGGAGGGMRVSERAAVAYALDFCGDSVVVRALVVGRAQTDYPGLNGASRDLSRPHYPERVGMMSGASIDTLFMEYDSDHHAVWVHLQKVPLFDQNVVLVDRLDGVGGPLAVVGTLSAALTFGAPPGLIGGHSPAAHVALSDSLKVVILRDPRLDAFVRP